MPGVQRIIAAFGAFACVVHAAQCDLAIVGAGPGGAYAAWQASEAGKKVCVFEMSGRPGGRIHSLRAQGPQKDLVVEAGAYRFAPHEVCENMSSTESWCIYNPITSGIVGELGLKAGEYDPDPKNWDHAMRILVDDAGHKVGYLTFVEEMLNRAQKKGADIRFRTTVRGLKAGNGTNVALELDNGAFVTASAALLNIPQRPLLKLLRNSGPPFSSVFPAPLYDPAPFPIMKLYIHYNDAWWRNYLGLDAGFFENLNTNASHVIHMHAVPAQSPAPLKGQYHDGDVRCDGPNGLCRGYLQALYDGGTAVDYFKIYHPWEGDSVLELSPKSAEHRELLSQVHAALVALHRPALDKANITEKVSKMLPDSGVMSIWSEGVDGIHAGCHVPKPGDHPKPENLPAAALVPFEGWPIYVANEAYGPVPCFAEGSLNMSSRVLEKIGVPHPSWFGNDMFRVTSYPSPSMDPFLFPSSGKGDPRRHHSSESLVV